MKNDIDDLVSRAFSRRGLYGGPKKEAKPAAPPKTAAKGTAQKAPARPAPKTPARESAPGTPDALGALAARSRAIGGAAAAQREEIERQSREALADLERIRKELASDEVLSLAQPQPSATAPGGAQAAEAYGGAKLEAARFAALEQTLARRVLGQSAYLRALCVALRRPCAMGAQPDGLLGAFAVCGPAGTGKALSLACAAEALAQAGVFASGEVEWVDLALYPTQSEEKLFLQDVYGALSRPGGLLVLTNAHRCTPGLLSVLGELFSQGSCALPGRYLAQNGRLVDASGALAANAVGEVRVRGKYLVLLADRSPDFLAERFGAAFLAALGDVCVTAALPAEAKRAIARRQLEALAARAKEKLALDVTWDDDALALTAAAGGAGMEGACGVLDAAQQAYRALAQVRLTQGPQAKTAALCEKDGAPAIRFDGGEAETVQGLLPAAFLADSAERVREELLGLVGLDAVKDYVLRLQDNLTAQRRRRAAGLKSSGVTMHMIFTGNPGTGKTTVARLVGRFLKAAGVLSGGQLVEVTRAQLVGRYVGHTAPMVMQVVRSALGGVLFIDEAYSLWRGEQDSFGLEAIDTLVKAMEDHRDDLVVVLAGYTREMEHFLEANSGLRSRFPNIIEFADYTGEELYRIAAMQAEGKGYRLDEGCRAPLTAYFCEQQRLRAREAGNGRLARNTVEAAILAQSRRTARDEQADLSLLLPQDFAMAQPQKEGESV